MRRRKLVLPKKNAPQTAASTLKPAAKPVRPLAENFVRIWAPTLVTALFIITFNVQAFEIPSGSMEKTLKIGDHVLVDRIRFAPAARYMHGIVPYRRLRHGDIVVFMSVVQPDLHLVKRVIGLPGDRIRLVNKVVFRNGVALKEPYAIHQPGIDPGRDDFPTQGLPYGATPQWTATYSQYVHNGWLVVPPGHFFVMGDNRDISYDSRYWGFVPDRNLIGRPVIVYWSYRAHERDNGYANMGQRMRSFFSTLIHFPVRTRWLRTFHLVR